MDRGNQICASVRRLINQRIDPIEKDATGVVFEFARRGASGGSAFYHHLADAYVQGFRGLCIAASVRLAALTPEAETSQHADELHDLLQEARETVLAGYARRIPPQGASRTSATYGETIRDTLAVSLQAEIEDVVENLRLGVVGETNVRDRATIYNIDARASQVALNSPGTVQSVGGSQSADDGIDAAAVLQLLSAIRDAMDGVALPELDRLRIEDATTHAADEVAKPNPDKGRLARTLRSARDMLRDCGAAVAASLIESWLKQRGLWVD